MAGRTISTPYEILLLTYAFNVTGQPVMSVPAGWTADGLPIGLQIVGAGMPMRWCYGPPQRLRRQHHGHIDIHRWTKYRDVVIHDLSN